MQDLKTIKALVKSILESNPQARNSDSYLYLLVIRAIEKAYNLDFSKVTITDFLLNMREYDCPPFESVRRSRQKIQRECPHLCACEDVSELRAENEAYYRDFARS